MNRKYEIAFLLREGESAENAIVRIKDNLDKHQSAVTKEDKMGLRDLAYEIRKKREKFHRAMYYFVKADARIESLPEIERIFKLDEDIIRYMILLED
ncbi:MAG: 30S ribosomal protein S6 [Brevinematales bacterium]|jgi:ribosomal protein S6|nr:30S ribosomal protein S6 [Brevinematales bacterium]